MIGVLESLRGITWSLPELPVEPPSIPPSFMPSNRVKPPVEARCQEGSQQRQACRKAAPAVLAVPVLLRICQGFSRQSPGGAVEPSFFKPFLMTENLPLSCSNLSGDQGGEVA